MLDPASYRFNMTYTTESLEETKHMPERTYNMAEEGFSAMDYDALSAEVGQSRVQQL